MQVCFGAFINYMITRFFYLFIYLFIGLPSTAFLITKFSNQPQASSTEETQMGKVDIHLSLVGQI